MKAKNRRRLANSVCFRNPKDEAYEDKLEGKISEAFWEPKHNEWSDQKQDLLDTVGRHETANGSSYESGVKILEVANKAYDLFKTRTSKEKRGLLEHILSNPVLEGETIQFSLKQPFDMLVETNKRKNYLAFVDAYRTFCIDPLLQPKSLRRLIVA